MYHDFSRSSVRRAGTSVILTINASERIATASRSPNSFGMRSALRMKAAKTVPMISAAPAAATGTTVAQRRVERLIRGAPRERRRTARPWR
jgi:hypothetical protein